MAVDQHAHVSLSDASSISASCVCVSLPSAGYTLSKVNRPSAVSIVMQPFAAATALAGPSTVSMPASSSFAWSSAEIVVRLSGAISVTSAVKLRRKIASLTPPLPDPDHADFLVGDLIAIADRAIADQARAASASSCSSSSIGGRRLVTPVASSTLRAVHSPTPIRR